MLVHFWGTRGSIPVAKDSTAIQLRLHKVLSQAQGKQLDNSNKIDVFLEQLPFPLTHTYGGNTSCVQLDAGTEEFMLCDMGTGVRVFGGKTLAKHGPKPQTYNFFMSHIHWDHIMGFPFFTPAYIPGNKIRIHGCHSQLEDTFRRQNAAPNFPVHFDALGADIEFIELTPDQPYQLNGFSITPTLQMHEDDSYGYRFERDGKCVVYSTDSEHKIDDPEQMQSFVDFFKSADLVIFDAMYSLMEAVTMKADWGHSSNIVGVELCQRAGAKQLCLFHHEPIHSDEQIYQTLIETRRFEQLTRDELELKVISAYDGLQVSL